MNNKTFLFGFIVLFSFSATAQKPPKLVERIERKGDELVIPYSKYEYPNGLTLIVHEDHSDPIVHVDVTYHVGSAREEIGKSGFAHFFEHMMFQGSDHVKDEEHFKLVTEAGGTMNGSTNMDRTNYFQTVPRNELDKVLWLEADRMGFLLDAVTQEKFEVQRSTVKNERGQRYDNRPYGLVREKTNQALFPYGHPYSWPTIGYLADLDRVDVDDLKKFFLRWYGPNNAVITVAGDVKTDEVVKKVNMYFGTIPAGPEVKSMEKQVPILKENRYISYEDNIRFPYLMLSWPVVPSGHEDEAALDALAYLLSNNKSSPMHQQFVKNGKAMSAYAYNFGMELAGVFGASLTMIPGNSLAEAEASFKKILSDMAERPIDQADLNKFITGREVSSYRWLESVSGKSRLLAQYETYFGNPNRLEYELKQYQSLTPLKVKEVLKKYILNKPAVILSVYPKGKPELIAATDNFTPKLPESTGSDPNIYGNLTYVKAKDTFDRSKMPVSGPAPLISIPAYWTHQSNKVKMTGMVTDEAPTVSAVLYFPAGHIYEQPEKAGLAQLTARLLNEGTAFSTAEALEDRLESLGSSVQFSAGEEKLTVSIFSLSKYLDSTVAITREMLFNPRFDAEDFAREQKKTIEGINNKATQPGVIADQVFNRLIYGASDIRSIPSSGTIESVTAISLEDVKTYHQNVILQGVPELVVVGDIKKDDATNLFGFLGEAFNMPMAEKSLTVSPNSQNQATQYFLVHRPEAAQSEIRMGYLALPFDATGPYFKSTIMNYPLGGSFNSRINLNLREDKGFTYGARGNFDGTVHPGPYRIATAVRTDATDSALVEIVNELKQYKSEGITDSELSFTRNSLTQGEALKYETPWQKAGFLNRVQQFSLSPDFTREQQKLLNSITTEEINAIASERLPLDRMVVVIVGDREQIHESLKSRGFNFVELDEEGNPLF